MAVDEVVLSPSFDIVRLSVHQSSRIAERTSKVIHKLAAAPGKTEKPALVCLTAKGKAACKLISVVEIARRELKAQNVTCYQYNVLTSELIDLPRDARRSRGEAEVNGSGGSDESDAFEAMCAPRGGTKKRNMPLMTVYLSRQAVNELRKQYGEQT